MEITSFRDYFGIMRLLFFPPQTTKPLPLRVTEKNMKAKSRGEVGTEKKHLHVSVRTLWRPILSLLPACPSDCCAMILLGGGAFFRHEFAFVKPPSLPSFLRWLASSCDQQQQQPTSLIAAEFFQGSPQAFPPPTQTKLFLPMLFQGNSSGRAEINN